MAFKVCISGTNIYLSERGLLVREGKKIWIEEGHGTLFECHVCPDGSYVTCDGGKVAIFRSKATATSIAEMLCLKAPRRRFVVEFEDVRGRLATVGCVVDEP